MKEEEGASTGGLLASVRERTDTGDGVRQYSEVIVEKERVQTSAEARGRSATRESVGVQYRDPAPIQRCGMARDSAWVGGER